MKVAVEAKDESRKMDIVRFESIVAKYGPTSGIKVDKVVVVSSAGFTEQVHKRAELEGFELLTLTEALTSKWPEKVPQKLVFAIQPHLAGIHLLPANRMVAPRSLHDARFVCTCCGKDHGSPHSFVDRVVDEDFIFETTEISSRAN